MQRRSFVYILSLVSALMIAGCATQPVVPITSDRLFPFGVYEQRILITPDNPIKNAQAFRGVLSLQKEKTEVAGLSPFGNTVFRILEEKGKPIQTDIFVKELKPHGDRIKEYYEALREILVAKRSQPLPQSFRVRMQTGEKMVTIKKYDEVGIPKEFGFATDSHKITVTVLKYELSN